MKRVNLQESAVRESKVLKVLTVHHIAGKINPADLLTKELRDGAHFRRLRDSFMSTRAQVYQLVKTGSTKPLTPLFKPSVSPSHKQSLPKKRGVTWDLPLTTVNRKSPQHTSAGLQVE